MLRDPVTGRLLEPYETLVFGPPPRVTVVDMRPGAVNPPWISMRVDGYFQEWFDNGQGAPQQLPEITVIGEDGGPRPVPWPSTVQRPLDHWQHAPYADPLGIGVQLAPLALLVFVLVAWAATEHAT